MNKVSKKRLAPSESDSKDIGRVTRSKTSNEQGSTGLEIPDHLYEFVQEALALEEQLKRNKSDKDLKTKLREAKCAIAHVAEYYILCEVLPSGWNYDPNTAHTLVPKVLPRGNTIHEERKKIEKRPRNPCIDHVPLDELGQKAWLGFKELDAAAGITAHAGIVYPIDKKTITPVKKESPFFNFIGDFALQAFNKSYQMYVNKSSNENISEARFVKCYYHKLFNVYLFHMTIEAIEQGNLGSYDASVECKFDDGAITLDAFVLTDRKPSGKREGVKFSRKSTYETIKDRWSDPEVDYEVCGMVRRRTKGGGYDFHSPKGWNKFWPG